MSSLNHCFEKHQHWAGVKLVCQVLVKNGYKAFLAGGCVRDGLLGRKINDFDVATNARPEQVENLFEKTLAVGKAFGVIVVPCDGYQIEVATFRQDGDYKDGRHPTHVDFSSEKEDALRRDFTVNAMFYDLAADQVVDFVDGRGDLTKKEIKAVGEPELRFKEDHLRMLRAVRFSSQLGFKIEEKTYRWIRDLRESVKTVSMERQVIELEKIFGSPFVCEGINQLLELNLWEELFPDLPPMPDLLTRAKWYFSMWDFSGIHHSIGWALLLLPYFEYWQQQDSKEQATQRLNQFLKSRKLSNENQKNISFMVTQVYVAEELEISQAIVNLGESWGPHWIDLWWLRRQMEDLGEVDKVSEVVEAFTKVCTPEGSLPPPLITGADLIQKGIKKGPQLGALLKQAYHNQLAHGWHNKELILGSLGIKV